MKTIEFLPILVKADDSITSIPDLLIRTLTSADALAPWIPLELHNKATRLSAALSAKIYGVGIDAGGKSEASLRKPDIGTDLVSVFFNAVEVIANSKIASSGLLLIIDEFDRIKDTSGFASIVKSSEGKAIRFAIVGVASDVEELLSEHKSIERQIATGSVLVPPMTDDEVKEVFKNAHDRLNRSFLFSEKAISFVISCARGHPYIIHLIGRQALISAARDGKTEITEEAIREALDAIARQGNTVPMEATYRNAVRTSPIREYTLKKFAMREEEVIRTTELYEEIAREINIPRESISQYVGHLLLDEYGAVLEKVGERYYRFSDSVFKAYAASRPYEFSQQA